jgi:hypothetical protein
MLAKIKFRDYDKDYYYIVGFENIIIKQALPDKYLNDFPHFFATTWDEVPCIMLVTEHELFPKRNYPKGRSKKREKAKYQFAIMQDTYIYKEDLPKVIAVLKRAGQRLTDIKQKKKEFTITI